MPQVVTDAVVPVKFDFTIVGFRVLNCSLLLVHEAPIFLKLM